MTNEQTVNDDGRKGTYTIAIHLVPKPKNLLNEYKIVVTHDSEPDKPLMTTVLSADRLGRLNEMARTWGADGDSVHIEDHTGTNLYKMLAVAGWSCYWTDEETGTKHLAWVGCQNCPPVVVPPVTTGDADTMEQLMVINTLNDQVRYLKATIRVQNATISDQNDLIDELKSDIDELNTVIGTMEREHEDNINDKNEVIDTLTKDLEYKQGTIDDLSAKLVESDEYSDTLVSDLASARDDIGEYKAMVADLTSQLSDQTSVTESVKSQYHELKELHDLTRAARRVAQRNYDDLSIQYHTKVDECFHAKARVMALEAKIGWNNLEESDVPAND